MNKDTRNAQNARVLRALGYHPEVVSAGEIRFKFEGGLYIVLLDDEVAYWSLQYPRFWSIRDEAQREKVEDAAMHATEGTKVAKVYVTQDDKVTASLELLLTEPESPPIARALRGLSYAVELFKERMGT